MTLNNGKHQIAEMEGVRCTVVESKVTKDRADFLKKLLTFNGYEVKVEEEAAAEEGGETTYSVGVTDLVFNAVIVVYQKRLRTPEGHAVTPAYWNQWRVNNTMPYWLVGRM